MNGARLNRVRFPALASVAAVLASLACGGTVAKLRELAEPASTPRPAEIASPPTGEVKPKSKPTAEPVEEVPEQAASGQASEAEAIQVVAEGFAQDETELAFGLLLKNPNAELAIERAQYQMAAYDGAGSVVGTESGTIPLVLPGQELGFVSETRLAEGVTVSELEVQIKEGWAVQIEPVPMLEVASIRTYERAFFSGVAALISNSSDQDVKDVRVSAVPYDDGGQIIGGGSTLVDFVPSKGRIGVTMSYISSGDASRVELYPMVSSASSLGAEDDVPEGAQGIAKLRQGFAQKDREAAYALLIENPNSGLAIEGSQYCATGFSPDGQVLATDGGIVGVLLPGQTVGVAGELWLGEGEAVDHVEIALKVGAFAACDPLPSLTGENLAYQEDEYLPKVTGEIVNPYTKDVTYLRVSAIAYDQAGQIIGGGYHDMDVVPAEGHAAIEVPVTVAGVPETVELYAVPSSLSDIQ